MLQGSILLVLGLCLRLRTSVRDKGRWFHGKWCRRTIKLGIRIHLESAWGEGLRALAEVGLELSNNKNAVSKKS